MTKHIDMTKEEYTSLFKCTRCGQCTYGKEAAEFTVLCPVHKKRPFFFLQCGRDDADRQKFCMRARSIIQIH